MIATLGEMQRTTASQAPTAIKRAIGAIFSPSTIADAVSTSTTRVRTAICIFVDNGTESLTQRGLDHQEGVGHVDGHIAVEIRTLPGRHDAHGIGLCAPGK